MSITLKVRELINLLDMDDGSPAVQVWMNGRVHFAVIADEQVNRLLMELAEATTELDEGALYEE